ncbi:uncharacterized protein E0L32_003101 [Thyridium curvatum]|uniref:N-acetyltransferase domain-containing protein n=1 Tax=Thyridium curvatum TaxID=1093900 RepID=A0A507BLA8_9PEZI|nr:uncharacterized protein E0L32_003101 [Thyridium curvatum]TPX17458.1 hypothetical protein E0L32_003101 [Thyridium curvatum]
MQWHIEVIPRDEQGQAFYLDKYKNFRLMALRVNPGLAGFKSTDRQHGDADTSQLLSAFGSTLARELAFDDSVWLSRLANPVNAFFVAVRDTPENSRDILSSVCVRGPLPPPEDDEGYLPMVLRKPSKEYSDKEDPLLFMINGIWTLPEARRMGVALALNEAAKEHALSETRARGRSECVLTVEAYLSNLPAVSFYQRAGYSVCGLAGGAEIISVVIFLLVPSFFCWQNPADASSASFSITFKTTTTTRLQIAVRQIALSTGNPRNGIFGFVELWQGTRTSYTGHVECLPECLSACSAPGCCKSQHPDQTSPIPYYLKTRQSSMATSLPLQQLLLAVLLFFSPLAQAADRQGAPAHQVQARAGGEFIFPGCVNDCVGGSGCGTNDPQCMCKAARGNLLEAVVTCMSKHCTSQIATAKIDFLAIMVTDCAQESLPIPSAKIQSAQRLADQLAAGASSAAADTPSTSATLQTAQMASTAILRLPSTSSAQAAQSSASPARSSVSSAAQSSTNGPASTSEDADTATTSSKAAATPSTTLEVAVTSKAAAKTDAQKSTSTKNTKTDPTDTTPFGASEGSIKAPLGWLSLAVPLLATLAVLR